MSAILSRRHSSAPPSGPQIASAFFRRIISAAASEDAAARLAEAGYIPMPVAFTNLAAFLKRLDADLETFLQDYPIFPPGMLNPPPSKDVTGDAPPPAEQEQ